MEKFIVSARKYRPQTFDTVVGQEHITTTLKNAIKNQQLAHAFLFCGPRGVGKTTCARILAKTINCENPSTDGEACDTCPSCVSFNNGTSLNIHELDAASNNSVDDIRELVNQVRFAPQAGKYKVYIIDEVHMLSSSAFNAFLKTLEEPPPYAIFILATTEKHKILPTILSRCQIFDFKRITIYDTVNHLKGIAEKENIQTEEAALQLIAQKSEGCMRDSLSILDKIVSFTNGQVNYENTIEHLNILDAEYYFKLIDCMLKQDLAGAMLLFNDINNKGFEGDMVLNGFAEFIRNLLICKDSRIIDLLEVVDSFKNKYVETSKRTEAAHLISALNILNEAEINYKVARNKRLHVELAIIRLCYLSQALEITASGTSIDKKKLTDSAKSLAFKTIRPIVAPSLNTAPVVAPPKPRQEATLIIKQEPILKTTSPGVEEKKVTPPPLKSNGNGKIATLESIRKKVHTINEIPVISKPISEETLTTAWNQFIELLKKERNPAWKSFHSAKLNVIDANSFGAVVLNNVNRQFLDSERIRACEYLQKELENKQLQFYIVLLEGEKTEEIMDVHLSAKEQYQKIIEEYPLVKELKDRLKMDLDY